MPRLGIFVLLAWTPVLVACANAPQGSDTGGAVDARGFERFDASAEPTVDGAVGGLTDANSGLPSCSVPGRAIVTDIDETLTTSDLEWLTQMLNGAHDPAMRPGGVELVQAYAARGYFILYLTSRPEATNLGFTGEAAWDATHRWLEEHGYPVDPNRTKLQLSSSLVFGDSSADYKAGALQDMVDQGFIFDYAYGNATSDIAAYETVGIAKTSTFIIGANAGVENTTAIVGEEWVDHVASFVPGVAPVCDPGGA